MLTAHEVRQLERLTLAHSSALPAAGSRHARTRGYGLEFRDYRHYQPGDDPRFIDWTVHARLRQLVVRVFRAEGQMRVHLLVDSSASMSIGSPSKLACAARLAAALAYVAVGRRDAVGLTTFDAEVRTHLPASAGRPQLFRAIETLRSIAPAGPSAIDRALIAFASATHGPGLVVVLSDFFDTQERLEGLRFLMYRGLVPALVQVVADEDIDPALGDEAELVDVEYPSAPAIVADPSVLQAYRDRVTRLSGDLRGFCFANELPFIQLRSTAAFDDVLGACLDAGLLDVHA